MSCKFLISLAAGFFVLLCAVGISWSGSKVVTFNFRNLDEWEEKSFKGNTSYTVEKEDGRYHLHARSRGSASGLFRKVAVKAGELPVFRWSWKVAQTLATEDAYRKSGDDFAARVYIVFPGRFFWQTRALVYVYSDKLPVDTVVPNAHSANAAVIAVESGNRHAGAWRHEARRYLEDYRRYFHEDPPDPAAVAVMTDSDNSGSHAEAWYGDMIFTSE